METLKQADYEHQGQCNYISGISPTVNSSGGGSAATTPSASAAWCDYLRIRQLSVADGEMFTKPTSSRLPRLCVLGQTIVDNLFPDGSDP